MAKHSTNTSSTAPRGDFRKHKSTKTRKRLHMKKIENSASLQTTFSKRRNGLFKKAAQLNALCGIEAHVLVFSPYGRPFIFSPYGRPFGFLSQPEGTSAALRGGQDIDTNNNDTESSTIVQSSSEDQTNKYPESINLTVGSSDMGLVREEEEMGEKEACSKFWWNQPIQKMKLQELKEFKASLQGLRDNVATHLDEMKTRELALRDFLAINFN